jgi:Putative zinc-finger
MSCQMMVSLGVYVLGAADAGERARVEAHLPGCPACRAELMRLAPLPGRLAGVPGDMRPPGRLSDGGATQPTPTRTRARASRPWRASAAAACVAAAAGAAAGFWLAPTGVPQRPATVTLSGTNPATHMSMTAALTATSWGTSIQLRLRGLPLNVPCRLIVRSRSGATEVAGVWDAWRDGPITVPASVGWYPSGIARLQVATAAKTLVTVSVKHRTAPARAAPGRVGPHDMPRGRI